MNIEAEKQLLKKRYDFFRKYGSIDRCDTCGDREYCIHNVTDMSAICFKCSYKKEWEQTPRTEPACNIPLDLADFARI